MVAGFPVWRDEQPYPATSADDRSARLGRSLSGTNLERAGNYNQRIVLQAIRVQGETTRSELAEATGLTSPTIANITKRLLDQGLIIETGRRRGGRGQPATRLAVNPDGCFAIGLNIDRDHLTIVVLDLAGTVRSRAFREVAFAMPDDVLAYVRAELDGALAGIDRARVIGVGIALPDDLGRVALPHRPENYGVWNEVDVAGLFRDALPWPVHLDNDAAAAAIGEAQFGSGLRYPSFFYLLISAGLGGGLVIDGSYYRGATSRSGEIGFMPSRSPEAGEHMLQDSVSMSALFARLERAGLPAESVDDLDDDDPRVAAVLDTWLDDAARSLVEPLIAVNCLINPEAVLIGGRLPGTLIDRLAERLTATLGGHSTELPALAPVVRASMSSDSPAIGAAILPFTDRFLPSDAALMKMQAA